MHVTVLIIYLGRFNFTAVGWIKTKGTLCFQTFDFHSVEPYFMLQEVTFVKIKLNLKKMLTG